jgi:hypothetical protein
LRSIARRCELVRFNLRNPCRCRMVFSLKFPLKIVWLRQRFSGN